MKREHCIGVQWRVGIFILAAVGLLTGFRADALRANWKYAGETSTENGGNRTLAFYDAENVEYLAEGGLKVWVKSIDASEIEERVAGDNDILKKVADKTAQSYYPPYFLSYPDLNAAADSYIEMTAWEEAANIADVKTKVKRLYEIDCREGKYQSVSAITYRSDGTTSYSADFERWSPITPDSTGAALQKILCR